MSRKNAILQKFRNIPKELQLICIGTTQAHFALDFLDCQMQAFNMALYLNPVVFSQILLQKYNNKIQKNAVVLITLQYPIFCIDNFENIAKKNEIQYAKILLGKNPYISKARQMFCFLCPNKFDKNMRHLTTFEKDADRNRFVNHYKPWELELLCQELIKDGWDREIGIKNYVLEEHRKELKKANAAMKRTVWQTMKLVRYCLNKQWRPILLGLPYSGILNQCVPYSFKRKCFYRNIDYIQKHTSCKFLDYSMDERMQDINNYMNIWFLNERGRQKFTKIVMQDINNNQI